MIVRAVWLRTWITVFTQIKLVVFRMILLLFPSMTVGAMILCSTPFLVIVYIGPWAPVSALVFGIIVQLRLPSIVLPVVRVYAKISLMVDLIVGTPHGFKMKHVEIYVFFKPIYEFNWYLGFIVSEWAVLSILTITSSVDVRGTKLGFVLIRMVKFFYSVVRFLAQIPMAAVLTLRSVVTHLWLVGS